MTDKEIAAYKHRIWRQANPEKVKAYRRAYYLRRKARLAADQPSHA